jgi:uncharacterized membrane protein
MSHEEPIISPPRSSLFSRLRRYFFTGLIIIAPAVIAIWATIWFIDIFDGNIKPLIPAGWNPDDYLPVRIPGTGLLLALIGITLAGALAANLVGRTLFGWWDGLLNRTPIVRSIYKSAKQIFETVFSEKGTSFRYVCLVEWPRSGIWTLAFVSREVDGSMIGLESSRAMYACYVATTPNPTGGYLFFADKSSVRILDLTVDEGLKLLLSMGLVFPEDALDADAEIKTGQVLPA